VARRARRRHTAVPAGNLKPTLIAFLAAHLLDSQHRDDLEDEELASNQLAEAMPTTIADFRDHPLCVLHMPLRGFTTHGGAGIFFLDMYTQTKQFIH
jgi:hypothetical protein